MRKQIILSLLFIYVLIGCKRQEEQLDYYNQELEKFEAKPVYKQVKSGLKDTINDWANKYQNILLKDFTDKEQEWCIDDGVFFNSTYTKAILLISIRDLHKLIDFGNGEIKPPSLDYIDMVFANLEKDGWHYYYASMPNMVVPREAYHKVTPMTFLELSKIGRIEILQGYYKSGTCEINDSYFDEYDVIELKRQHQRFIKE